MPHKNSALCLAKGAQVRQLIPAFLALIMLSCGSENKVVTPLAETVKIFPLKIGNYWIQRNIRYKSDTIHATDTTIDTVKVLTDTVINGFQGFKTSDGACYAEKLDGIYIAIQTTGPGLQWCLWYKYPVSIGDKWTTPFDNDSNNNMILLSKDTSIQLGSNTYTCYLYHDFNNIMSSYYYCDQYFQLGVGPVFCQSVAPNGLVKYRSELISYKVN
jgi:hypothetical protein